MLRLQSLVFPVLLAAAAGVAGANAEPFDYNPAECATDPQGMVYLALGRTVLRLPEEMLDLRIIGGKLSIVDPSAMAPPPDPLEPEGCPGNPVQSLSFRLSSRLQDPTQFLFETALLTAERFDVSGDEPIAEQWYRVTCERHGLESVLPNGLIGCAWPPDDPDVPRAYWPTRYRARPEIHSTPVGRPFIVDCWLGHVATASQFCFVRYRFAEAAALYYQVNVQLVPISEIVAFDRGLQSLLAAALMRDFRWGDDDGRTAAGDDGDRR